jgi:hypothetical protein
MNEPLNLEKYSRLAIGFSRFPVHQLPLPPALHLYFETPYGIELRCHYLAKKGRLKLFGPDDQGRINYIFRGDVFKGDISNESFAHARGGGGKAKRYYPMDVCDYDLLAEDGRIIKTLGRGHGSDHADSIDDMTRDELNLTPQDRVYNEEIRNPLVRYIIRAEGGQYREIAIYSRSPRLTRNGTPIPEGFLFISYPSGRAFFFPNYIDYKAIALPKEGKESAYKKYLNIFEIPTLKIKPLIYSPRGFA